MQISRTLISLLLLSVLGACASGPKDPDIALTYNRIAAAESPYRNPVIVIPGVLGSKLKDIRTDQPVWGAFVAGAADPQTDEGLKLITAPYIYPDGSLTNWSHVVPNGALTEVKLQLLGIPLKVAAYAQLIDALGAGGFREQQIGDANGELYDDNHYTAYQFDYDWRLSNADNAAKLFNFVQQVRARVSKEYERKFGIKNADIKVDIVAHSMGGLLTRYMLRYGDQGLPKDGSDPNLDWSGSLGVERVVLIGTPNAGSPNALNELVEGKNYGWPLLPFYNQAVLGSFASLYELMPRDRHNAVVMKDGSPVGSIYDIKTWEKHQWGLMNPKMEKTFKRLFPEINDPEELQAVVHNTLKTHLENAKRFNKALDIPAAPPERLIFNMVLGDADETDRVLAFDQEKGKFRTVQTAPGDGVVPRYSALMDERADGDDTIWTPRLRSPIDFDSVVILPYEHIALTQSKVFIDNLLYWLLVEPRPSGTPLGYPINTN
jgi:pimeloyl-ACP methyl ester carboxylesterase